VAQACRVLGRLDITKAATGHVSARIPGRDQLFIRARGPGELGVRYTTDDQVIECDFNGKIVGNNDKGLTAPLEVFIHTAVYKARPEVFSVVHVHPPTVVLFTIADKPLLPIYGAYDPPGAKLAIDGIPTYPRSILIDSASLGDDLVKTMGPSKVCMMRGHGITTAGPSVEQAALYAIQLNELATMNFNARQLGEPRPIPKEDQDIFRDFEQNVPPPTNGGRPGGRDGALWRYYCALTES
jgi:ribulose-5-phosphate 4-epimerase/fuculose-1-phosphate aldolase